MSPTQDQSTRMLRRYRDGEAGAGDELLPVVYEELRAMAQRYMRRQPADHTLAPTALVHEAYLRLIRQDRVQPDDRTHFIALSARAMRSVLVDHARARATTKRGGDRKGVPLDDAVASFEMNSADLLALDEALRELTELDAQQGRTVELRFFGGLTNEETAAAMGVSISTVERNWRFARAWLFRALSDADTDGK